MPGAVFRLVTTRLSLSPSLSLSLSISGALLHTHILRFFETRLIRGLCVLLFFLPLLHRRYAGGSLPTLPRDLGNRLLDIVKLDDYQEPYQALKYAPYYSYSTVVMEMKDMMLNNKPTNVNHTGEWLLSSSNTLKTVH